MKFFFGVRLCSQVLLDFQKAKSLTSLTKAFRLSAFRYSHKEVMGL